MALPIDAILIGLGIILILLWVGWAVYRRLYRWYVLTKPRVKEDGVRYFATRRNVIRGAGFFLLTGLTVRYSSELKNSAPQVGNVTSFEDAEGLVSGVADGLFQKQDPWHQRFNSDIVEEIRFSEDGRMFVTMAEAHGADGFGIWHVSDNERQRGSIAGYGRGFFSEGLPRYGGTVSLNLGSALESSAGNYPSNRFKLIAVTVNGLIEDPVGQVRFVVPQELMP